MNALITLSVIIAMVVFYVGFLVLVFKGRGRVHKERAYWINNKYYVGPETYAKLRKNIQSQQGIDASAVGLPIIKSDLCKAKTGW